MLKEGGVKLQHRNFGASCRLYHYRNLRRLTSKLFDDAAVVPVSYEFTKLLVRLSGSAVNGTKITAGWDDLFPRRRVLRNCSYALGRDSEISENWRVSKNV